MGNKSREYFPVTSSQYDTSEDSFESEPGMCKTDHRIIALREKLLLLVIFLQTIALVVSVLAGTRNTASPCQYPYGSDRPLLYSPAQVAVEHQVKSFTPGREQKTIYQGLSDDVDMAWAELYDRTIMKIPKSEAALLPNKTYPIKNEPGYYLAGLDIFHQLHCLNKVRRALHREYYVNDTGLSEEHVSHCVNTIRQSLMCNADISVNVWQWSEELSMVVGYSTQAHSCRNFDKLRDWARQRWLKEWIDPRLYVEDDLPTPPVIS